MFDRMHIALVVLATLTVPRLGAPVSVSVELEQRAIARIEQVIRDNRDSPTDGVDHVSLIFLVCVIVIQRLICTHVYTC